MSQRGFSPVRGRHSIILDVAISGAGRTRERDIMFKGEGSFARRQLEKHGWTEGAGLGAQEHGISEAIKVKLKHDTRGVGHDAAKEFTHHWWDLAFNKAVSSITVESGEDGVVVKKKQKNKKEKAEEAKKTLYSNFIKGSLLNNGTETAVEKEATEQDSSDEDVEKKTHALMLPEDELFQRCGGRTAHKGARHGLKLNGKLARVEEQEKLLLEKYRNSSKSSTSSPSPADQNTQQNGSASHNTSSICDSVSDNSQGSEKSEKKKKKKMKKEKRKNEEGEEEEVKDSEKAEERLVGSDNGKDDNAEDSNSNDSDEQRSRKKKKKRKEKEDCATESVNGVSEMNGDTENSQDASSAQTKKKKKKKRNKDLEVEDDEPQEKRSKLNKSDKVYLEECAVSDSEQTVEGGGKVKRKKLKKKIA